MHVRWSHMHMQISWLTEELCSSVWKYREKRSLIKLIIHRLNKLFRWGFASNIYRSLKLCRLSNDFINFEPYCVIYSFCIDMYDIINIPIIFKINIIFLLYCICTSNSSIFLILFLKKKPLEFFTKLNLPVGICIAWSMIHG